MRGARAEDRIRAAKETGLTNLPLHDFAANQTWCTLVALAADLTAWMQTLPLTGHDARRWERMRLLSIPARHAPAAAGCCTWPPPRHSPLSPYNPWTPSSA